eukprot:TRINITY_DN7844_c0_g1_i1.p1 TRINITY_DN7844_c0_g1~~TRINITY_DN7844_c0_g1_i1.p1  ORF type:complete len:318 (-),score=61.21 TRINITY_DN7844_c0_g1_i1:62-1015(-)
MAVTIELDVGFDTALQGDECRNALRRLTLYSDDMLFELKFTCSTLETQAAFVVAEMLQSNPRIVSLSFNCYFIGGRGWARITQVIAQSTSLKSLCVDGLYLEGRPLGECLQTNKSLSTFEISTRYFHFGYFDVMSAFSINDSISEASFNFNKDAGWFDEPFSNDRDVLSQVMFSNLASNQGIHVLEIDSFFIGRDNQISDKIRDFITRNRSVRSLTFGETCHIDDRVTPDLLMDHMQQNTTLVECSMRGFEEILKRNKTLNDYWCKVLLFSKLKSSTPSLLDVRIAGKFLECLPYEERTLLHANAVLNQFQPSDVLN